MGLMDLNKSYKDSRINLRALFTSVLGTLAVGLLAGFLSGDMRSFYECLIKPSFAPPGWVFAPVWLILYILMGLAAYRIYSAETKGEEGRDALFYYKAQLVFNFMWPILFFRFALLGVAFLDILVLLVMVIITTVKFYRIDKTAGYLMIPYLLWLIYAAVLNYAILVLNQAK